MSQGASNLSHPFSIQIRGSVVKQKLRLFLLFLGAVSSPTSFYTVYFLFNFLQALKDNAFCST